MQRRSGNTEICEAMGCGHGHMCREDVIIRPGETVIVPTGLKMAIPEGYEIQVRPEAGYH